MSNFLTPDELTEWTGYKRRDCIIKQLRRWKIQFRTPTDGWPRVPRGAIYGRQDMPTGETPDYAALRSLAAPVDH